MVYAKLEKLLNTRNGKGRGGFRCATGNINLSVFQPRCRGGFTNLSLFQGRYSQLECAMRDCCRGERPLAPTYTDSDRDWIIIGVNPA